MPRLMPAFRHDLPMSDGASKGRACLRIDLGAVSRNYRAARDHYRGSSVSAVLKCNAYGIGILPVATALWREGCRAFWVEDIAEGQAIRETLGSDASIFVLSGLAGGGIEPFAKFRLIPVLGSRTDIECCASQWPGLKVALNIDTGIGRMALHPNEAFALMGEIASLTVSVVLSQVASFDTPNSDANIAQLELFKVQCARFPQAQPSIATSSLVYGGPHWHIGMARIGSALYGVQSSGLMGYPVQPVVTLDAPVLSVQDVCAGTRIGYTRDIVPAMRIATIGLGYADGLPPRFGHCCKAFIGDMPANFVGESAMAVSSIDVTAFPRDVVIPGSRVEIIGPHQDINEAADRLQINANRLLLAISQSTVRKYAVDD